MFLPSNIRQGSKGQAKTTTLDCYKDEQIMAVKFFALDKNYLNIWYFDFQVGNISILAYLGT